MDVARTVFVVMYISEALYAVEPTAEVHRFENTSVQLNCPHRATSSNVLAWEYSPVYPTSAWTIYTLNRDLNTKLPSYPRFNVTGDFSNGEYNFVINILKKEDEGYYKCNLRSTSIESVQKLVILVGPSSVGLQKTDNKLLGTEGQSLQITCTSAGGNPVPDVQILRSGSVVKSDKQIVTYTIQTLDRSDDGQTIVCRTGYTQINSFPMNDSAEIVLNLKPMTPTYSQGSVSVIDGNTLEIMCTSIGSRPVAFFNWYIDNVNITDSSVITSSILDGSTFEVISRLRLTLTKDQNGRNLRCKAINIAAPDGVEPALPITVDVKYPPTVTVGAKTLTEEIAHTELSCIADGNPDRYTFYGWTHETLQGTLVRRLNGTSDGTLTLQDVNKNLQYQNTGRYNCTVGNGIPDTGTQKSGSGVITVNAPPVFSLYNDWSQRGEIKKSANISVYVYSVPAALNFVWYNGNIRISDSGYKTFSSQTSVSVVFHDKEVEVEGYKVTLAIAEVKDADFTTYKLVASNSRGSNEQTILFNSISAPDPPQNLKVIDQTEESITIQWVAGYNGGYKQTFAIFYRKQGTKKWTTLTGLKTLRGDSNEHHQIKISGLQHSTKYEIKMFAENKLNKSAETLTEVGMTDLKSNVEYISALKRERDTLKGVAVGLSVTTVIFFVVNVMLVYRLLNDRRSHSKNSSNNRSVDRKSHPEVYYNITDDNDDKDPRSALEVRNYEKLGTKDKPNVYEGLDHKTRADKKHCGKGESYETVGAKDKPNVYEELDQKPNGNYTNCIFLSQGKGSVHEESRIKKHYTIDIRMISRITLPLSSNTAI